ncbi:eEF1-gamma domain-containing protein [Fistulina hepatica ATCC 64428]|uniref:EEF1-gamma domain-containing protein n=1 Tax=Fistulina hepatica ATCC 64428 TaxID=1128425 RepID=A0A0D7AL47_9AGAR|nr:eEF1-gamma domain-containing protein [Fistulina hepatica ATCC 64428]
MASIGTLWTTPAFWKTKAITATAAWAGLSVDIPADYVHFQDNKKPEFLARFPHGKIPALETKNGFRLFEAIPIARYIASLSPNSGLLGSSLEDAASIDQWVHFIEGEVDMYNQLILQLVNNILTPYTKPLHTTFLERLVRGLKTLNSHLTTRTFLVGERITFADIVVTAAILRSCVCTIDTPLRAQIPSVMRLVETVINQPKLAGIFPTSVPVLEKAVQHTPPPKEKKEPKPATAPAPKKEKKEKKAKKDDDEEEEPLVPEEPKAKNPLDDLPKSNFNLEEWKRVYSNNDTRGAGGALEWLYKNFDKNGFSIWRVDFKYNEELTLTFMSSNQITGFFNRLEASRKYLFGSCGVLGQANNSIITGALICRGPDIVPVVNVAPDYESYSYSKLDLDNAEDKAFFEGAMAWDLEIGGKKWVDGKNFK